MIDNLDLPTLIFSEFEILLDLFFHLVLVLGIYITHNTYFILTSRGFLWVKVRTS